MVFYFFFFFQAEDGIRDPLVTGVQTCALPICGGSLAPAAAWAGRSQLRSVFAALHHQQGVRLLLNTGSRRCTAAGVVEAVELPDGQTIPAATVVVGIGVRPETQLAATAGWWWTTASSSTGTGAPACHGCSPPVTSPAAPCALPRPRVRIEHWNNALHQGAAVGTTMPGRPSTNHSVPTSGPTSTTTSCRCSADLWWISRD